MLAPPVLSSPSGPDLSAAVWAAPGAESSFLGQHHNTHHWLHQCCGPRGGWQLPGVPTCLPLELSLAGPGCLQLPSVP